MNEYKFAEPVKRTAFPIAAAGYPFIGALAFITAILALLNLTILTLIGLAATLFVCMFFRDPDRLVPVVENAVVSPADGRILYARRVEKNPFVDGECIKISIFMSVFNVHVNRIPHEGRIIRTRYFPGKFLNASWDKASELNERNAIVIETGRGEKMAVVQIAGLIARRIISTVQEHDAVVRGQRFGMICFGSRLDVYLPVDFQAMVKKDQLVSAGSTILGYLKAE